MRAIENAIGMDLRRLTKVHRLVIGCMIIFTAPTLFVVQMLT